MSQDRIHLFGDFTLDLGRGCLLRKGEEVHLRPQAYEVLKYLAERRGRLVSKDRIIEEVWRGRAVTDGSLGKCIEEVREALGEEARRYVRNVRGRGYLFDPGADEWSEQIDVVKLVVEEEEEAEGGVAAQGVLTPAASPARLGPARAARRAKAFVLPAAVLLAVCLAAGAAYYFSRPDRPLNAAGVRSLAVLPFKPLVPEGRDEALELGMADTLIAKLSNVDEITVRPLGAVRRFGGLEQDPFDAGRRLGVEAVLDGTVQRSGDRVGVRARLMHVGDGRQLWEGSFDAPFGDIFSVQDAISEKVAAALQPRLASAEEKRLAKHDTENVEAYQLYLRGRYHVLKLTPAENQKGVSYYQQAIAVDPSYALAYFGLAQAYSSLALSGELPAAEWFPKAKTATLKALELDDQLAEAHASLGYILFWYEWDWNESENRFKRALELNPNSAETHMGYALLLSSTGRHAEALDEIKRAREHDPLNLLISALEGQSLTYAGRTDEALARLQSIFELDANYWLAHSLAASAYIEKGMYGEAVAEARKAKELSGASSIPASSLGYALAKSGRPAEARGLLGGLLKLSGERYVSPYHVALIYHALGERDETLAWLERGLEKRDPRMTSLKVEPKWNDLRTDPRFQNLLRRVGFTS